MIRCQKTPYPSKEHAVREGAHIVCRGGMDYLRPYYCKLCRAWHITKMKKDAK